LTEALPIYSGGLEMLAGDHLKSASSQGIPLVAVGLLYQQGYFRQLLGEDGSQMEVFPYNGPGSLPVTQLKGADGRWPRVRLELPGRTLMLRTWEARVGSVRLLLLDSNDPMNSPSDRAITGQLYNSNRTTRLLQELVLGVGGWQLTEKLGIEPDVCHLNEGHAAFVVVARAASFAKRAGITFDEALWATRAGNVFTTHTPVEAAFDVFDPGEVSQYAAALVREAGIPAELLLAMGRMDPENKSSPFNMAFLAMRGSGRINGVSRLHGEVSRRLFAPLFRDWPIAEVPVSHITNGVHVPTWDSAAANELWQESFKSGWSRQLGEASAALAHVSDEAIWNFRNKARADLVEYVRRHLRKAGRAHGQASLLADHADRVLDCGALTIGFARRFTGYKRPALILHDLDRLMRILTSSGRPVQIIIAGKAHPNDHFGRDMVREVARFCARPEVRHRAVFLDDYDMDVGQAMTGGVDVWLNTPIRPLEACGTSGMKAIANGGINLSVLDGWWDEAFTPEVGWAIGGRSGRGSDAEDAEELYRLLEQVVIPEFYDRDSEGLPRRWIARVRASMIKLTDTFSSDRMVREYSDRAYLPAATQFHERAADGAALARDLASWHRRMSEAWPDVRFTGCEITSDDQCWRFAASLDLGRLNPDDVRVELFSENPETGEPHAIPMTMQQPPSHPGDAAIYFAITKKDHPAAHYTPRAFPARRGVITPIEAHFIRWQRQA